MWIATVIDLMWTAGGEADLGSANDGEVEAEIEKTPSNRPDMTKMGVDDKQKDHTKSGKNLLKKSRRSRSWSSSESQSDKGFDQSESEDSDDRHKRRKREKKEDRKKEKERKKKKKEREKKHKKERERKHKKERSTDKDSTLKGPMGFGARGIIRSSDIYAKDAEFRSWLIEVKNIDPGILKPMDYKTYFAEYMEDYNVRVMKVALTLKYYNLNSWETKSGITQKTGLMPNPAAPGEVNLSRDEEQLKKSLRIGRPVIPQVEISEEQILEVKKAFQERIAADRLTKQGFKPSEKLGVRYESNKQGKAWNTI
ncbi:hypothetical protein HDU93_002978 [Gonapodya sp. JEL0774]|nr:hypothetical protein HDU93_002978 [Gonapodya sp. JEL0774]